MSQLSPNSHLAATYRTWARLQDLKANPSLALAAARIRAPDQATSLQAALLQHTQAGILVAVDKDEHGTPEHPGSHSMPSAWVRASIAVRANANVRGHSAVSIPMLNSLLQLLAHRITPIGPLRGSISASGDLTPMSYIAGTIEGSPDIYVRLCNDAHLLAVTSQALTALGVEALTGTAESFHPFIHATRPHRGQIESAANILTLLQGSHLATEPLPKSRTSPGLIQDRYAWRSAPQWLGPQLEDLTLASTQLHTELNSSTDNPLINPTTTTTTTATTTTTTATEIHLTDIQTWTTQTTTLLRETYHTTAAQFLNHPHTADLLGAGTKTLYNPVRKDLQVPFHRGRIDHPTTSSSSSSSIDQSEERDRGDKKNHRLVDLGNLRGLTTGGYPRLCLGMDTGIGIGIGIRIGEVRKGRLVWTDADACSTADPWVGGGAVEV
ncbi:aromatic amino acid ammonia-lyase [Aspergillus ibericus CBS 121593]|uniref:L-Aspartase-like protein n=1 Tax=Aspergillus ibericus CBS 121593 TaxID=1448316 RepID=A0A395H8K0_9EURO|nr:L-Aspartase-like protein [Aspergillus ibericus CBS 121593]RAL04237.1 L-Aspartase-like protein [Aspergillus ibericus CBS 121593]